MIWNDHSREIAKGDHAFLGASKYSWLNYDEKKLIDTFNNFYARQRGNILHDFACQCITLKQELKGTKQTLNMYVNDAIRYRLRPEQPLYYSENCFGTADAIGFNEKKKFLRIHDLKTGVNQASLHQLEIYAALFCLEYKVKPGSLSGCELRIYQNDDILIGKPEADDILPIMDKIIKFDKILKKVKNEQYGL